MRPYVRALIRRLFYFLAGLALGLPGSVGAAFALRGARFGSVRLHLPEAPLPPALDLALRLPVLSLLLCVALATAFLAAATYIERRYPLLPQGA